MNSASIILISTIITLITIIMISLAKSFNGEATFFSSYFDLFTSLLPFKILIVSHLVFLYSGNPEGYNEQEKYIMTWMLPISIGASILYNFIKSLHNNWNSKFLALCIFISRITIGYLLPLLVFFSFFELLSPVGKHERPAEVIGRKIAAGVTFGVAGGILHKLISDHRYYQSYSANYEFDVDELAAYYDEHYQQ